MTQMLAQSHDVVGAVITRVLRTEYTEMPQFDEGMSYAGPPLFASYCVELASGKLLQVATFRDICPLVFLRPGLASTLCLVEDAELIALVIGQHITEVLVDSHTDQVYFLLSNGCLLWNELFLGSYLSAERINEFFAAREHVKSFAAYWDDREISAAELISGQ
ncbi:MAG: hypothetical protein KDA62_06095 [Planctomycetales bacterium]|nr:hypothetical protein [Planctomycetales bacterium]